MNLESSSFKDWSLFLDRDGVINKRIPDDYIRKQEEFEFLDGVLDALAIFNLLFKNIVVVTNQQGVGKGLMKPAELEQIHAFMVSRVAEANGRIDKVYYCPALKSENNFCRKPAVGMGLKARKDFPDIQFNKSFMVGDTESDLKFGKRLGMKTVFISENLVEIRKLHQLIDLSFPSLLHFSSYLQS
jgi:histidinol-phosphate phosphatase family protein